MISLTITFEQPAPDAVVSERDAAAAAAEACDPPQKLCVNDLYRVSPGAIDREAKRGEAAIRAWASKRGVALLPDVQYGWWGGHSGSIKSWTQMRGHAK